MQYQSDIIIFVHIYMIIRNLHSFVICSFGEFVVRFWKYIAWVSFLVGKCVIRFLLGGLGIRTFRRLHSKMKLRGGLDPRFSSAFIRLLRARKRRRGKKGKGKRAFLLREKRGMRTTTAIFSNIVQIHVFLFTGITCKKGYHFRE